MLATRRPGSSLAGKWEFPGGKVADGESLSSCIARELCEELGVVVTKSSELLVLEHHYPDKTVRLHFMLCELDASAVPQGLEGQQVGCFTSDALRDLDFVPADGLFVSQLREGKLATDEVELLDKRTVRVLGAWLRGERDGAVHVLPSKPDWLRVPFTGGKARVEMRDLLSRSKLHTVCESAKCPNLCDCWKRKTATFMVLGDICTRNCRFCAVTTGRPLPPDVEEPKHVAESVQALGLRHAVLTCVTRDDLPDGGAGHIAETVKEIVSLCPNTTVEVLVSDCLGNTEALDSILQSGIHVFGHNLETVERLTPRLRSVATYRRSLDVLEYASTHCQPGCVVKSGMMLGVGETEDEIRTALQDLRRVGVEIVTLGQYLQPTSKHWDVDRMVTPEEFAHWTEYAEQELGFRRAVCGPLVRSSYMAEEALAGKKADA